MTHDTSNQDRPLAVAAFAGSALFAAFWALYVTGVIVLGDATGGIAEFEAAFPVADGLATVFLVIAGAGLWRGHRSGRFAMTAAAAMVLYLGLLDLTFYSRHGLFAGFDGESAFQLGLILACLAGGAGGLVRCWRPGRTP